MVSLLASLPRLQKNYSWRKRTLCKERIATSISLNGLTCHHFASNDYLNLSQHPEVKRDFVKGANRYGLGSTGSPLVCGYDKPHQQLEEAFAEFLGREKVILFNSGYHANLAIFQVIAERQNILLSDKYCHASLLDGIRLSRAKHLRFVHDSLPHAIRLLDNHLSQNKILITESIFSMEGQLTDLRAYSELCRNKQALLFVDDSHGLGVLGESGRGACEHFGLSEDEVPYLIQSLGKAMGSMGAVVSGSQTLIEALIQHARSYRYSTAIPPAIAYATLTVLSVLRSESWRRMRLKNHICLFNQLAKKHQLSLVSWSSTPIRSVLIGSNERAFHMQNLLQQRGYHVACIRTPTVPKNSARLRISLCSEHLEESIISLIDAIAELLCLTESHDEPL